MSDQTNIGWTNKTWNPWRGCAKIDPGCKNCYMFTQQARYGQDPFTVTRTKTWGDPHRWQKEAAAKGETVLVFTCSWSDFFHQDADAWRAEAWAVIRSCPNLTFQVLTKRADRIAANLPADWDDGYPNVWLGVSVSESKGLKRIGELVKIPAVVRFLSVEPLLERLDLKPHLLGSVPYKPWYEPTTYHLIDWVIVGGESGPDRRDCGVVAIEDVIAQCILSRVPVFCKQDCASKPGQQGRIADPWWHRKEFPKV